MTLRQLKKLEAELENRGYRKWTKCLTSSESWAWFKTFEKTVDEEGEAVSGYKVAFRVWDYTEFWQTGANSYGLDVWSSPLNTECRMDFESSWEPFENIDKFEAMAKDFYELTRKYKT